MKFTATGFTDVAIIVLFWPDNLPEDTDEQFVEDPVALVDRLNDVGKLVKFPCEVDNYYSLAVFVNEEVPDDLHKRCTDERPLLRLIASGDGYFGGAEYIFKDEAPELEELHGLCEAVQIPAGTYTGRVFCTTLPNELHDSWVLEQAGLRAVCVWELQTTLVALSIALVLAVFASWLFVGWLIWYGIIAAAAASILAAMAIARTAPYRAAVDARKKFKLAFPDYVLQLASPSDK